LVLSTSTMSERASIAEVPAESLPPAAIQRNRRAPAAGS